MNTITDILLTRNLQGIYDIAISKGDLVQDNGYKNALLLTFGTNARALSHEVAYSANRKGWWGSLFNVVKKDDIGSRLWLLNTEPFSETNLNTGKALLQQAFSWLIVQNIVDKVEVRAELGDNFSYKYTINLFNGNDVIESKTFDL